MAWLLCQTEREMLTRSLSLAASFQFHAWYMWCKLSQAKKCYACGISHSFLLKSRVSLAWSRNTVPKCTVVNRMFWNEIIHLVLFFGCKYKECSKSCPHFLHSNLRHRSYIQMYWSSHHSIRLQSIQVCHIPFYLIKTQKSKKKG